MTASSEPRPPARRSPGPVVLGALLFGLAAGPIAWFLQLIVNYGMASHYCFPASAPLITGPVPGDVWTAILVVNLVALVVALAGAAISYRNCRRSALEARAGTAPIDRRMGGRSRFLSTWGGWLGLAFFAATAFNLIGFLVVSGCYV